MIVNSTADTADSVPGDGLCDDGLGQCTLRAALDEAAASIGHELIAFSIFGSGVRTIRLTAALPEVSEHTGVTVDGTTQTGYSGQPLIEIDGSAVAGDCLLVSAGHSNFYALNIHSCGGTGLVLRGAHLITVQRCFLGTDPTGLIARGNGAHGLFILEGSDTQIGGTGVGEGNLLSGNGGDGLLVQGSDSFTNVVQGNIIGLDAQGTAELGNARNGITLEAAPGNTVGGIERNARNFIAGNLGSGVVISGSMAIGNQLLGNTIGAIGSRANGGDGIRVENDAVGAAIGGLAAGEGNLILHNGGAGVRVASGDDVAIRGNAIFGNALLGIDLGIDFAVTPNDPLDGDAGANGLQNFPELSSAVSSCTETTLEGRLEATADTSHELDFFVSDGCAPSGHGQGMTFLGSTPVVTDASGTATFSVSLPVVLAAGSAVTATTTRSAGVRGATSEFSACVPANQGCFTCGDLVTDPGEECDEGGLDTPSCDADCSLPRCGDNRVNGAASEECDDGNTIAGDGCDATCSLETCLTASLIKIERLLAVALDDVRAEISWDADPGALIYHLNSVTDAPELGDPTRAPGNGRIECNVMPPETRCEVTSTADRVYYQALSACGPGGIDEGPF